MEDAEGKEVSLKPGAEVEVTIEAEPHATIPKKPGQPQSEEEKPEAEAGKGQKQ